MLPRRNTICLFLVLTSLVWSPEWLHATHQRAAEITYRHLSGLSYEITLISYTYTPSQANYYRDFLPVIWGDGTSGEIPRVEIRYLPDSIMYNRYVGQHTFPAPATYTISCEDPNRNGGIINIPNSINTPLFIYSELTINPFLGGFNNSPVLLIPPVDNGCVQQPFYHNPGAYDPDGDSLSYRLVPCRGMEGLVIPGYTLPAASVGLTLDPVTGDLLWNAPVQQGEFNVAILIEEWRSGQKIGSVLRDMQIIVLACQNKPPVILPLADTCVEAGKKLRFIVKAYDPDSNVVTLTATGGPFVQPRSPATMSPDPAIGAGHTEAQFSWATLCEHVRKTPYQVFFTAKDNAKPVDLVTIRSMNILVVGPAPENLSAEPSGNNVNLTWDPYKCTNAIGFFLYRKSDSTGYIPGYCQTGVPPYLGYTKIAEISPLDQQNYTDDNGGTGLARGFRYCYLLVAIYPDGAQGYASNEACAMLKKDVAMITHVSITKTHETGGTVYVAWSMPTEIDSLQAPGPYKYLLYRSADTAPLNYALIDSLNNLADTVYNDRFLDTRNQGYTYRVDLYNDTQGNRFLIGPSSPASSMFLQLTPMNRRLILRWSNNVPWRNTLFTVFRKSPGSPDFDSVGVSSVPYYNDSGLENGLTYCYLIRSQGTYAMPGFIEPIINFSQENCAVPDDRTPPCPPSLTVSTLCDIGQNTLKWKNPDADSCHMDIARYYVYFSTGYGAMQLVDSIISPFDSVYHHTPDGWFTGCYRVVAVDSAGNQSDTAGRVCVDLTACPEWLYHLPNIFTPNGDGFNDLFRPFPYKKVNAVDIRIYDRWGRLVFETGDPGINWNGEDKTTGQPCSDGTYFYVGEVYEETLQGILGRPLHGSVTLSR